jgi:Lipid A 3-O-deacylase (PagL)/Outer membrane protein beta-barrel domain
MSPKVLQVTFISLVISLKAFHVCAQDKRAQLPTFLSHSYFNVNLGYINYHFSNLQMEPGYRAESIEIPHPGIRFVFGHDFNKYLSAQISYMKPLSQVEYKNVNVDDSNHTLWMHVGTLTLKSEVPVQKRTSIYGEGGLGIITRRGFDINQSPAIKNASYGTIIVGGGLRYRINNNWDFVASTSFSPAHSKIKQPYTLFFSGGLNYKIHPLAAERVEENSNTQFIFPKNLIQVGYTTNAFGYGINNFFSKKPIAIFWGGRVEVEQGFSIRYQRNVFHTRKLFSLDLGTSVGYWESNSNKNEFYTISAFPLFRFTVLHSKPADLYFQYSVAGPSFVSKTSIDQEDTGKHFTFQDFMGIGFFMGRNRNISWEININHYSNGNIFPHNAAVKIPLSFNLGYTF